MKRYIVIIASLLMLFLSTVLYGQSDDQPKWNTTLFGSYFLDRRGNFGIGGALGYRFTPRLELEGEIGTIPAEGGVYIVSEGVLYNFDIEKTTIYLLTGISVTKNYEVSLNSMLGGGIKKDITKKFKMRLFDCRLYFGERVGFKLSTGLMWTF